MLAQKEYYKIVVKGNALATVYKMEFSEYNDFQYNFGYVYHTKNGERYPLRKYNTVAIDMLVADDDHLEELLTDLVDQGFCDEINLDFA